MKKRVFSVILALIMISAMIGCGSSNENTVENISHDKKDYVSKLEDGVYYIRTSETNECNPVYFGESTFEEGSIKNSPDKDRVMWFREDFDKIPTLYKGDSLIYFTKSLLDEKMTFERFEDLGYTIGICGMEKLKSGRFAISTDPNDKCTYPGADTDDILLLTNKTVTLDKVGEKLVREYEDSERENFLSEFGTILRLKKNDRYHVEIYDGTVKHEYDFLADVKAMGSSDVEENYVYEFESEYLINIPIPENFNTGYYMINGAGIFRYINGSSYDDATNFNIPNVHLNSNNNNSEQEIDNGYYSVASPSITETAGDDYTTVPDGLQSTFEVITPGEITVEIYFTIPGEAEYTSIDGIEAYITTPLGATQFFNADPEKNVLYKTFEAMVEGEYVIDYINLDNREPHVDIY